MGDGVWQTARSIFPILTPTGEAPMATNKQARGTKRTCQNDECGSRFYDLNRNPITCPICGSIYELASAPLTAAAIEAEEKAARKSKRQAEVADGDELPAVEGEEALADVEGEEPVAAEADETFLEEEEDEGGDVSGIIPVAEGEEEV
jgi:uncharacterized protein (TIGR02300 family)